MFSSRFAGGESGPVVVPGKPDASSLVEVVEAGDKRPEEPALTKAEQELMRDRIERGKFPKSGDDDTVDQIREAVNSAHATSPSPTV